LLYFLVLAPVVCYSFFLVGMDVWTHNFVCSFFCLSCPLTYTPSKNISFLASAFGLIRAPCAFLCALFLWAPLTQFWNPRGIFSFLFFFCCFLGVALFGSLSLLLCGFFFCGSKQPPQKNIYNHTHKKRHKSKPNKKRTQTKPNLWQSSKRKRKPKREKVPLPPSLVLFSQKHTKKSTLKHSSLFLHMSNPTAAKSFISQ